MSAADGTVLGLTKIVDAGLPGDKWNLVVIAEGFTAAQQGAFQGYVNDFVADLFTEPPFNEDTIACAINVYRLDVASDEAGADFPDCDNGGAAATTAATYFDASFCQEFNGSPLLRLVHGDSTLVRDTLDGLLPGWDQALVIVNDTRYGGAGGEIAWTTVDPAQWLDVAIHELGHSIFGLADEYGSDGDDVFADPEPSQPNVTTLTDRTDPAFKWADLFSGDLANTVTMPNADCSTPNTGASPVPADRVGLFEGAKYHHCGIYRPQHACKMRAFGGGAGIDFCAVCQRVIRDFFAPFAGPAATGGVTIASTALQFDDVPVTTSAVRAATFSVDSCTAVTFTVTTQPNAPFSLESPAVVVAQPSGVKPWAAHVWFRYDCGGVIDSHLSQAVIHCVETGENFNIDLTGNCVARPRVAAQLVLDQSGSMQGMTDEGRRKVDVLKDAATVFVDHLYDDNAIGLNGFHADPVPIMDVQNAGAAGAGGGRDDAHDELLVFAHVPGALTAIGDGIELARTQLEDARTAAAGGPDPFDRTAMVVLTDGKETASLYIDEVAGGIITDDVFAIGLGTGEQIEPAALIALTAMTGNYTLMTGNLSENDSFLLDKYYLQILAGLNNNDIILDPDGWLGAGREVRIPFDVTGSDIEITPTVISDAAWAMEFSLIAPNGEVIDPGVAAASAAVQFSSRKRTQFYRVNMPLAIKGDPLHGGTWQMVLKRDEGSFKKYLASLDNNQKALARIKAHGLRYSANAYVYSNLRLKTSLLQSSYEPGATLTVRAGLSEAGGPFGGRASATAQVKLPDGGASTLTLHRTSQGVFEAKMRVEEAGIYSFRIVVRGATAKEQPFTREQMATAPIWKGGDIRRPPQSLPQPGLCELLDCLRKEGLTEKGHKRLKKLGVDLEQLAKCLCSGKK